jgi:hypothetical protein
MYHGLPDDNARTKLEIPNIYQLKKQHPYRHHGQDCRQNLSTLNHPNHPYIILLSPLSYCFLISPLTVRIGKLKGLERRQRHLNNGNAIIPKH